MREKGANTGTHESGGSASGQEALVALLVCYTAACVLQAPGNNSKCDLQLELCLCAALDCSAPLLKGGQTEESVAL